MTFSTLNAQQALEHLTKMAAAVHADLKTHELLQASIKILATFIAEHSDQTSVTEHVG